MTIGIAAICNRGKNIILASDGAQSAEVVADLSTFKFYSLDEWAFLFAGTLSNADLILEDIRNASTPLSRANIQSVVRKAYKKRQEQWAIDGNLAPYDIDPDELKKMGIKIFGEQLFSQHEALLRQDCANFNEHVLVTGWGKTDTAAMIYGVYPYGAESGSLIGFAAIGSGGTVAQNTLMLLGCARHVPFEYALYAVASAKFAAESCEGVGKSTFIGVTHKRTDKDDAEKCPINIVQPDEIKVLRNLWDAHTKPKIPEEAIPHLCAIAQKTLGAVTPGAMIRMTINAMQSASEKSEPAQ